MSTMSAAHPHDGKPASSDVEYAGGRIVNREYTVGGHPYDNSQPTLPVYHRKLGNPASLGLMAFAGTTMLLSLFNVQAHGVTTQNAILGMALCYGGLAQFVAGVEEFVCGNSFGATVFTSYGAFWLSFACVYIPQFGIIDAYKSPEELNAALALYLAVWGAITFLFMMAALKSSISLVATFLAVDLVFWLLCAGFFNGSTACIKAGGGMGIVAAALAAYCSFAGLLTPDTSHFQLPVGPLSRKDE